MGKLKVYLYFTRKHFINRLCSTKLLILLVLVFPSFFVKADFDQEEEESDYISPKASVGAEIVPVQKKDDTQKKNKTPLKFEKKGPSNGKTSPRSAKKLQKEIKRKPQPVRKKAAKKPSNSLRKKAVKLKSNGLKGSRSEGKLTLLDNVRISQGDLEIRCNKANILFDARSDEIERIVASGRVKMKKRDYTTKAKISASSSEMTYEHKKGLIILTGSVEIIRGIDIIKGKKLVYDLNTGWISGKQVDGMLQPKSGE